MLQYFDDVAHNIEYYQFRNIITYNLFFIILLLFKKYLS